MSEKKSVPAVKIASAYGKPISLLDKGGREYVSIPVVGDDKAEAELVEELVVLLAYHDRALLENGDYFTADTENGMYLCYEVYKKLNSAPAERDTVLH